MILVLSKPGDVHADRVEAMLRDRGARVVRFDPGEVGGARVVLEHGVRGQGTRIVTAEAGTIDLAEVSVVWLRRPTAPRASDAIADPAMRRYIALELELLLDGIWAALDCAWLPGRYPEIRAADHKLAQLQLAAGLGFTVPPSLITNDPAELVRFYEEHGGALISKLASPAVFWTEPRVAVRYTQPVELADLGYAASMLRHAPMLFQPRIDKALELRVTVVGEQVFAAATESQRNPRTQVDSRSDFARTEYQAHRLPGAIEARCRAMTARSGLGFATIDLIVTPAGDHVFLELNPNGQYLWIEERTGLPISDAISELLIGHEASDDDAALTYG